MTGHTHRLIQIVLALAAAASVAGGVGTANATARCGLPDSHRVVHCSDGNREFIDGCGHLVTIDRMGRVLRDLSPGEAWY